MKLFGLDENPPEHEAGSKMPLLVELVPLMTWEDNLRSRLKRGQWDQLRKAQYSRANYRCEICGESGTNQGYEHPVECHEVWLYDDDKHIQKLERLISLCPLCHRVKHAGRTINLNRKQGLIEVVSRLMDVNHWSQEQAENHLREADATWQRRSQFEWTLDIDVVLPGSLPPPRE